MRIRTFACVAAVIACSECRAQIAADATLGTVVNGGPDFTVTGGTRPGGGANLFHSFSQFRVGASQSVNFDGPAGVRNVLARVTGGSASAINGELRCSIAGANLYLINPAGIIFGSGACLSVTGSFTATTAANIALADGGVFVAGPNPIGSVLTAAEPASFGFLGNASVAVRGVGLKGEQSGQLRLVAGHVTLSDGASLGVPGGRIDLVADETSGRVRVIDASASTSAAGPLAGPGGVIRVQGHHVVIRNGDASGLKASSNLGSDRGGRVRIQAGRFVMNDGEVLAESTGLVGQVGGEGSGGRVRIAAEDILIRNSAEISSEVDSSGREGGDVRLLASNRFVLADRSMLSAQADNGSGGNVLIRAGDILIDRATIVATASIGGDVDMISTGSVTVSQRAQAGSKVHAIEATGTLEGGNITIVAPEVVTFVRTRIDAETQGVGGRISIDPELVLLDRARIFGRSGSGAINDTLVDVQAVAFILSGDSDILSSRKAFEPADVASQLAPLRDAAVVRDLSIDTTCTVIELGRISTLVEKGRGGMAAEPRGWIMPTGTE